MENHLGLALIQLRTCCASGVRFFHALKPDFLSAGPSGTAWFIERSGRCLGSRSPRSYGSLVRLRQSAGHRGIVEYRGSPHNKPLERTRICLGALRASVSWRAAQHKRYA